MKRGLAAIGLLAALCLGGGCSTRQGYDITQAWQRNECQKLTEQLDRERCLQRASGSHASYEKQREAVTSPPRAAER